MPRSPVIIFRLQFSASFFLIPPSLCSSLGLSFKLPFHFRAPSFQYHVPTFKPYLQFHASQRHALPSQLSSPAPSSMWRHTTSATATRASHTSVERNHGNMADSGGCCVGGHTGARILQSLPASNHNKHSDQYILQIFLMLTLLHWQCIKFSSHWIYHYRLYS